MLTAQEKVNKFLVGMFSAKRLAVHRADSRRCRTFSFLCAALESLSGNGNAQAKTLRALLDNCNPREDDELQFRTGVLDAFRRSAFSDFRGLAAAIAEEEKVFDVLKLSQVLSEDFLKQYGAKFK